MLKTGLGYIEDSDGHIIAKFDLPKGEHPTKDGYVYIEVATRQDLDSVEVYTPSKTTEQIREGKIQTEIRQLAIDSLIAKGEITK